MGALRVVEPPNAIGSFQGQLRYNASDAPLSHAVHSEGKKHGASLESRREREVLSRIVRGSSRASGAIHYTYQAFGQYCASCAGLIWRYAGHRGSVGSVILMVSGVSGATLYLPAHRRGVLAHRV